MTRAEDPVVYRWSRRDYARLIDRGFLDEDDPIELLDGLLLVKEPQSSLHRTTVLLVAAALERAFGEGWFVQTRSPIIHMNRSSTRTSWPRHGRTHISNQNKPTPEPCP